MQNIWIFQLTHTLDSTSETKLNEDLNALLAEWVAHEMPVMSSFEIKYSRFILVRALNNIASGCSIDWMTHIVADTARNLGNGIADSGMVLYKDGDTINMMHFQEMQKAIKAGELPGDTILFDATVVNGGHINEWEKPISDSWLGRFLPVVA